jgi:hypothetical protein
MVSLHWRVQSSDSELFIVIPLWGSSWGFVNTGSFLSLLLRVRDLHAHLRWVQVRFILHIVGGSWRPPHGRMGTEIVLHVIEFCATNVLFSLLLR